MAIEGPIEELGLADLLQLLSLTGKTGTLTISGRGGEEIGKVFLKDGSVASASREGAEEIGEMLLRAGRISRERLRMARDASTGFKSVEEVLVDLDFVTSSELEKLAQSQVEETVYELFEMKRGYFRFEEGDLPSGIHPLFSLKVESLLMEGSRRIDEWSRISQTIPSLDRVLELAVSPGEPNRLSLKPKDWAILSLIDGKRTVREIVREIGGEFETGKHLYDLVSAGVLKVVEPAGEKVEDHASKGERLLREGLYGEAAAELELALEQSPQDSKVLYSLGEALYRSGSYGDALSSYRRLSDMEPERVEIHYHLGFCLARLGDLSSAISEWETFLSLSSSEDSKTGIRNMVKLARELDRALGKKREAPIAERGPAETGAESDTVFRETFLFREDLGE